MRSFRSLISGALLVLGAAFVFQACSKQGEAQRCEKDNGNDDCEPPLTCTNVPGLDEPVCCPENQLSASTDECRRERSTPVDGGGTDTGPATDTGAGTDTGTGETATDTGAGETATDTGAGETATDTGSAADTATTDAAAD